jgi:hypothetical protein
VPRIELDELDEPTQLKVLQTNATFYELFSLCSHDSVCNDRFYIDYAPNILYEANAANAFVGGGAAASNDASALLSGSERERFLRFKELMFVLALQPQSPLGPDGDLTIDDYTSDDAIWWLRILRTARFCTDNEVWEPPHGCTCPPEKVCGVRDAAHQHWEFTSIRTTIAVALFVVIMVAIGVILLNRQITASLRAQILELASRIARDPANVEALLGAMRQFGEITADTRVQLVFGGNGTGGGVKRTSASADSSSYDSDNDDDSNDENNDDDDDDDDSEDDDAAIAAHMRRHHHLESLESYANVSDAVAMSSSSIEH